MGELSFSYAQSFEKSGRLGKTNVDPKTFPNSFITPAQSDVPSAAHSSTALTERFGIVMLSAVGNLPAKAPGPPLHDCAAISIARSNA